MKLAGTILIAAAVWAGSPARLQAQPLATLTVRNYGEFENTISQLGAAVHPDAATSAGKKLGAALGLRSTTAFDAKRPWQAAIWFQGGGTPPLIAFKVPADDISKFKDSLDPEGVLADQGKDWKALEGGFGLVTLRETATLSDAERGELAKWEKATVSSPDQTMELVLTPSEPLRNQALMMLGMVKMTMTQAMSTNNAMAATGANPQAMGKMFGAYFDALSTIVQGTQRAHLGLALENDNLAIHETIMAKPDTDLAGWLVPQKASFPKSDMSLLDPDAMFSVAAHFGDNPRLVDYFKKFLRLSFAVQNVQADDAMIQKLEDLMDKLLPMNFVGSASYENQILFSGLYSFPESKAAEALAAGRDFFKNGMKSMVGTNKLYSAAVYEEKDHVIDGVSVDRLSITMNTNSPLFSMPGQKEQLLQMWPGGKMVFDYAVKGNDLLFASPGQMKEWLARSPDASAVSWPWQVSDSTVSAGYFNLLSLIKPSLAANPVLPPELKEKFARLDPKGTGLAFQIDLNNRFSSHLNMPVKLLREFSRLNKNN